MKTLKECPANIKGIQAVNWNNDVQWLKGMIAKYQGKPDAEVRINRLVDRFKTYFK